MKQYAADLHIHTAVSPCAAKDMSPGAVAAVAAERDLDIVAICDHNTAAHVRAVEEAAGKRLTVIAGMEIATAEEVHVVALFPTAQAALNAADDVGATLAPLHTGRRFWDQPVMNAMGGVVGAEDRALAGASGLSLTQTLALIHGYGGLAVAAHVDRPSFSVLSQLGLFPPDAPFDALEVSALGLREGRDRAFAGLGLPLLCSSDAHSLLEIGEGRTVLYLKAPSFDEVALALRGASGRSLRLA